MVSSLHSRNKSPKTRSRTQKEKETEKSPKKSSSKPAQDLLYIQRLQNEDQTVQHTPNSPKKSRNKGKPTTPGKNSGLSFEKWTGQKFDQKVVSKIYYERLQTSKFSLSEISSLESCGYFEDYLWPHLIVPGDFTAQKASSQYLTESCISTPHLMSILLMLNEKLRQGVSPWSSLEESKFSFVFSYSIQLLSTFACSDAKSPLGEAPQGSISIEEATFLVIFLIYCLKNLSSSVVRQQFLRVVSIGMWDHIRPGRRDFEVKRHPILSKNLKISAKQITKASSVSPSHVEYLQMERRVLVDIMSHFTQLLSILEFFEQESIDPSSQYQIEYCCRVVEFLIDIQSQLPTRRFFNTVCDDFHFIAKCTSSVLYGKNSLFRQLVDILKYYCDFEINDFTGETLTSQDLLHQHYEKFNLLQKIAFLHFPDQKQLALANPGALDSGSQLLEILNSFSDEDLIQLGNLLQRWDPVHFHDACDHFHRELFLFVVVDYYQLKKSQTLQMTDTPLYPTESILWDENLLPSTSLATDHSPSCMAIPKLNLQFLNLNDYLLRNFNLFKLESAFEIRLDIEDVIKRMNPRQIDHDFTQFEGWSRMGNVIQNFEITEIGAPNLGEDQPSIVKAHFSVDLKTCSPDVIREWNSLRAHDILFLINVQGVDSTKDLLNSGVDAASFVDLYNIKSVRGCEVEGVVNPQGELLHQFNHKNSVPSDTLVIQVLLDPSQYRKDEAFLQSSAPSAGIQSSTTNPSIYEKSNLVLRRKSKENNFKPVLETIRDLIQAENLIPDWLHDVFLGYGDPSAAHYRSQNWCDSPAFLDFRSTFSDIDHIKASFPNSAVNVLPLKAEAHGKQPVHEISSVCYMMKFSQCDANSGLEKTGSDQNYQDSITVQPYLPPSHTLWASNQTISRKNILFTPAQSEAIRAAMFEGLSLVVGPPGSGKTDVAIQIISNWYHNFPDQRIVIVTHSNQGLNQLFEKLASSDIPERHLLRLGHGHEELQTSENFGRQGRLNYILARRIQLLSQVAQLGTTLAITFDVSSSCEVAHYFYTTLIFPKWTEFLASKTVEQGRNVEDLIREFPFSQYFSGGDVTQLKKSSFELTLSNLESCFLYLKAIFDELEEYFPFEILRNSTERMNYFFLKQARIIAMTCTHAALRRKDFHLMNFHYENILIEESAQILDIETFIPLVLQNSSKNSSAHPLKRIVMIGDHNQLPPIIKNVTFQKISGMEQSLFSRLIKLGVPYVQLDMQGRCRTSLAQLFRWRYAKLGDLPHLSSREYMLANPGFVHEYQLIDVQDHLGVGESEPSPHFVQNLGEAEFVVALYMFMRLVGYPSESITILTTYNGQKHLLRDILKTRCSKISLFGMPKKVTTVDKYQGQQNDFVLLSLVRTNSVGHIRDIRRLVVALSRARLGLYIFCRVSLFQNCPEFAASFQYLLQRPTHLQLIPSETFPSTTRGIQESVENYMQVQDMPSFASFVYDIAKPRVDALLEAERIRKEAQAFSSLPQQGESTEIPIVEEIMQDDME